MVVWPLVYFHENNSFLLETGQINISIFDCITKEADLTYGYK